MQYVDCSTTTSKSVFKDKILKNENSLKTIILYGYKPLRLYLG